jgi:hypothetical protein
MSTYASHSEALHFSQTPEVKRGQVGILAELFHVLARGDDTSKSNRNLVELLSEAPEVVEAVDKMLRSVPKTKSRGSFAEMLKQRDETGLLRRQP